MNQRYYTLEKDEVFNALNTSSKGISEEEAKKRLNHYGKNVLQEKVETPLWRVFAHHFTSLMAILLWIGGFVAFIAGIFELGFAIWSVNLINGIFSFWQEYQAGKATDALKKMLPSYTRVIRDGIESQILTEALTVGDLVVLQEGDKISVDARLIEASDLMVNQSTLTGESNPIHKHALRITEDNLSPFEIKNYIFTGTSVANGTAKAVVMAVGMNTEFGKIADLTQSLEEEKSPLQQELDVLTKQISIIAGSIGVLLFIISMFYVKEPLAQAFIFALGMVVAFIPEGLLPTVTLSLAVAVKRMAKENALVKKLSAVETLGSTSVICSDKTGTLTQNEITVSDIWTLNASYAVSGLGYEPKGNIQFNQTPTKLSSDADLRMLVEGAALCSNAKVIEPNEESPRYTVLGDPTEACLNVLAQKAGLQLENLYEDAPRIKELPFDSTRKRMTTIHHYHKHQTLAFTKGAPKEVLELCRYYQKEGQVLEMSESIYQQAMEANDKFARDGLRVLALAYRDLEHVSNLPKQMSNYTSELIEQSLTFVGLVAMSDPARPEVAEAVSICHQANIRIIMITGDYGLTAESIAKKIGIVREANPRIITGQELKTLSDDSLQEALMNEVIFARMAPDQKYRVVSNLQDLGHIVAVTGDGVNDAPALKKADIGIAMGIAGTDVAKEAADVILTDDNFASIVKAIEEGRAVYSNIRKFLMYILNSNVAEAIPSILFLLSKGAIPLPLTIMQILAIDLGTDMLPALGLGTEKPEQGIMNRPPRKRGESLLNKRTFALSFLWYGLILSSLGILGYFFVNVRYGSWPNAPLASSGLVYDKATTMTLAMIVFGQIGMVLNCRTEKLSLFKIGLFSNYKVMIGILFEIGLIAVMMYVPLFQNIFNTVPLGVVEWCILCLVPIPLVLIDELRKRLIHRDV